MRAVESPFEIRGRIGERNRAAVVGQCRQAGPIRQVRGSLNLKVTPDVALHGEVKMAARAPQRIS